MKQKKIPLRKCLITREQFPKYELLRIVINKDNEISIDESGKMNGRGAYIKLTSENVEIAKTRKVFEREFKVQDIEYLYDQLKAKANE